LLQQKGEPGDKGDRGDRGDRGMTGPKGPLGEPSLAKIQGPKGRRGINGTDGKVKVIVSDIDPVDINLAEATQLWVRPSAKEPPVTVTSTTTVTTTTTVPPTTTLPPCPQGYLYDATNTCKPFCVGDSFFGFGASTNLDVVKFEVVEFSFSNRYQMLSIPASGFSAPAWKTKKGATLSNGSMIVAAESTQQSGNVWYDHPVRLHDDYGKMADFTVKYAVKMTAVDTSKRSDGIAFIIHSSDTGTDTLGGMYGYSGIDSSVAVILDIEKNPSPYDDSDNNHVEVDINGTVTVSQAKSSVGFQMVGTQDAPVTVYVIVTMIKSVLAVYVSDKPITDVASLSPNVTYSRDFAPVCLDIQPAFDLTLDGINNCYGDATGIASVNTVNPKAVTFTVLEAGYYRLDYVSGAISWWGTDGNPDAGQGRVPPPLLPGRAARRVQGEAGLRRPVLRRRAVRRHAPPQEGAGRVPEGVGGRGVLHARVQSGAHGRLDGKVHRRR
jgi:hypothetical protein